MVQAINGESSSTALYQQLMAALSPNNSESSALSALDSGSKTQDSGSIEDRFLNFLQKGFDKIDKNQDSQVSFQEIGDFVGEKVEQGVEKVSEFAGDKLKDFVSNANSPFNGLAEKFDFSNFAQNMSQTVLNAYKNQNLLSGMATSAVSSLL